MRKSAILTTAGSAAATLCCVVAMSMAADYPQWWIDSGVVDQQATVNDYAAANAGQLKWMAAKAKDHLDVALGGRGGAGQAITDMVAGWSVNNNRVAINLGQLKNVAKPFYDRLMDVGYTDSYPWTATTDDDADRAVANVGQVKNVFSFDLSIADLDDDGMPDGWERDHGLDDLINDADLDPDHDGLSNIQEFLYATHPGNADTDGDDMDDGWEVCFGLDPVNLIYSSTVL